MSHDPAPIIFVHTGSASYLPCVLWQAHLRNPGNEVILIGDWDPRLPFVTFEPTRNHLKAAKRFRDVYVHLSTLPLESQRSHLERWLLLESYVNARRLTRFVHADSDLLFFTGVDEHFARLEGFRWAMGKTSAWSPHVLFFPTTEMLGKFCRFLIDMYVDLELFATVYKRYRRHRDTHGAGGIGDMAALSIFIEEGHSTPYQLNQVVESSIFDQSVRDSRLSDKSEWFQKKNGVKEIHMQDGNPYFTDIESNRVRALTLHFQGQTKNMIRQFTQSPNARIRMEYSLAHARERTKSKLDYMAIMRRHYVGGAAKRLRRLVFSGVSR